MREVTYLLRRLPVAVVTILVAATLNFGLFRIAPGDPAEQFSHVPGAGPALQHEIKREFGLDRPLLVQYGLYLKGIATGNLGVSFQNRRAVSANIVDQLRNTIPMVLVGTLFAILIGSSLGILAAVRRRTATDVGAVATSMLFYSLPAQWVGLMLVLLLGGIFPSNGMHDPYLIGASQTDLAIDEAKHIVLPALAFGLSLFGQFTLIARNSMLEVLGADYMLTARAKGLSRWSIIRRHGLRNAALPTITLVALSLGYVLGGAILIEVVFSWPGIGSGTFDAVRARDYPMLQAQFLVLAVGVVLCNLAADLVVRRLDPRVRN